MTTARVIPVLLLKGAGLVKTVRFKAPTYLGDAVNVSRLFNDKEVDELVLLDVTATPEGRPPRFDLVAQMASECFMPLCYGGGVRTLDDMARLFTIGVEKVAINTRAVEDLSLLRAAAERFGSQSVIGSIDARRTWRGYRVFTEGGRKRTAWTPAALAAEMENAGAGEILVTSIDRDGTMEGYDLDLVRSVSDAVRLPVIACGGAGSLDHMVDAVRRGGASAAAAGSLFVFHGRHRAVLISYPSPSQIQQAFGEQDEHS